MIPKEEIEKAIQWAKELEIEPAENWDRVVSLSTKPLFSLTAQEVEASNFLYKIADKVLEQKIKETKFDNDWDSGFYAQLLKSMCQDLLTRIKQWQDEQN